MKTVLSVRNVFVWLGICPKISPPPQAPISYAYAGGGQTGLEITDFTVILDGGWGLPTCIMLLYIFSVPQFPYGGT